ncbi:MAG: hypothetical protein ACQESG_07155 [Nanobdellota archaeon]
MDNLEAILANVTPTHRDVTSLFRYSEQFFFPGGIGILFSRQYALQLGCEATKEGFLQVFKERSEPQKEKPDTSQLPGLPASLAAHRYRLALSDRAKKALPAACDMNDLKALICLDRFYEVPLQEDIPPEIQLIRLAKESAQTEPGAEPIPLQASTDTRTTRNAWWKTTAAVVGCLALLSLPYLAYNQNNTGASQQYKLEVKPENMGPSPSAHVQRAKESLSAGQYSEAKDALEEVRSEAKSKEVEQTYKNIMAKLKVKEEVLDHFSQFDKALQGNVYTQIVYHQQSKRLEHELRKFDFNGIGELRSKADEYENRLHQNIARTAKQEFRSYTNQLERLEAMIQDGKYNAARKEYYRVKGMIEKGKRSGLFSDEYLGD